MPEMLDVLTKNGELTGVTKTKQQVLADGDWRRVVHAWIVDADGNLLVQQRAAGRGIFDNLWDVSVGGGVAAGEPPIDAMHREIYEELGIDVALDELEHIGTWQLPPKTVSPTKVMKDFSDTYLVRRQTIDTATFLLQPEEVQAVKKIPIKAFREHIQQPAEAAHWVPHGSSYYTEVADIIIRTHFISHHRYNQS